MLKNVKTYSLPILSGFLVGTSYIPFPPWALFFCLTPLWLFWWKQASYKKIFISGWLTQFILNAIGFHWIAYTVVEFGLMPWSVGLAVLFLFCTLAHLYYPLAGVLWYFLHSRQKLSPFSSMVSLVIVFALCERLYPFLFYWHLGYPWLWAKLPGMHLSPWIGFWGLNLLTLFINGLLVLFVIKTNRKKVRPLALTAALTLTLGSQALGWWLSDVTPEPDREIKALIVQGNVGNLDKMLAQHGGRAAEKATNNYLSLTRQALENNTDVNLVIWPETAFPETIDSRSMGPQRARIHQLAREFDVLILTGAYQRNPQTGQPYNSLALLDGQGNLVSDYQKSHLLAFGEYFPFAKTFPILKKWFPMVANFGRGPGPITMETGALKLGPQICYEGLFDEFSSGLQEAGAQIFVNVTNDSWFGKPFEPYQHMYMTLARAVENRRPLIRATNTGISTVILADGRVLEHSPLHEKWYGVYKIPFHSTPPATFYVNLSRRWPWILLLALGLILIGEAIARTRKH